MATLKQIESQHASKLYSRSRHLPSSVSTLKVFLWALYITPLMIMEALFIPLLGWGLIIIALAATGIFLRTERSIQLALSWAAGSALGVFGFVTISPSLLQIGMGLPLYIMILLGTFSLLTYSLKMGFYVVRRVRILEGSTQDS